MSPGAAHDVARFMSAPVVAVDCHVSLDEAAELMNERGIRHLAVLDGGYTIGVLSERDIYRWRTVKPQVTTSVLAVFEAMSPEPYAVLPAEPLARAAEQMALRRIGAILVMDGTELLGILTTTDALRALSAIA